VQILYNAAIILYVSLIRVAAISGNQKAKLWIQGRRNWRENLSGKLSTANGKRIWIHCASLGEFEQGRSIIERIRNDHSDVFIILTFFSPSGFEIRKNYEQADLVMYLPADTRNNAKDFLRMISPEFILFIKYEFWINYIFEAKISAIPVYVASAIFRSNQIFFKWYGSLFRNALGKISTLFVQDEESKTFLRDINITKVVVSGDTRFDRVNTVASLKKRLPLIEEFKNSKNIFIGGSTWPEDENILFSLYDVLAAHNYKIIIAPHEVNPERISVIANAALKMTGKKVSKFSEGHIDPLSEILIIDTIGNLSSAYSYGNAAWIGGGFGKGIHNILEAASFGLPVFFGPNYKRFREAGDLISIGGAFTFDSKETAVTGTGKLIVNDELLKKCGMNALEYVKKNTGATNRIMIELSKMMVH
jgi:3-deoxy-D-manno-octulosonic-acid transferase